MTLALVASSLFLGFLGLYALTAAPSVLSGDSAEFQLAAPLLGVPHPTTYPLYVLLGKLATLVIPFGDLARRVTLVSATCAALSVALFFLLARRVVQSTPAAIVAALALGFTPGLWNAATLAEVYALLVALLVALAFLLATNDHHRPIGRPYPEPQSTLSFDARGGPPSWGRRIYAAAFVAGLGFSHHGLFAITGIPILVGYVVWRLAQGTRAGHPSTSARADTPASRATGTLVLRPGWHLFWRLTLLALCFALGLTPWLYPLVQYARYGPFSGEDYGLPRHYFWGGPASWDAALDMLAGGPMRSGIFRVPSVGDAIAVLRLVANRVLFEFGPIGLLLGVVGCGVLLRRCRSAWSGAACVLLGTLAYLLLIGPAVQDAPVFTLPIVIPWALWLAAGAHLVIAHADSLRTNAGQPAPRTTGDQPPASRPSAKRPSRQSRGIGRWAFVALGLLVTAELLWGYTREPFSNKRHLWLFRQFGEATLQALPPNAVVITHWEQGTTLQYLVLVEGRRPDVWVDIVEPADDPWGPRARRRYPERPVFFVGSAADVDGLPVELAREDAYADLFRLR